MKIETLKDLEAVIKLCRKQGISAIEVDNVKLALGDAPEKLKTAVDEASVPSTAPTEEELLFWSAQ